MDGAKDAAAAKALVDFLRTPEAAVAIKKVLADSESVDGGWGPDVTTRGNLIAALEEKP